MQAVILLPTIHELGGARAARNRVFQKVAGVPLLARVIATAARSGANPVILLHSNELPGEWLDPALESYAVRSAEVKRLPYQGTFDPGNPSDWRKIGGLQDGAVLWVPWNFVALKRPLEQLVEIAQRSLDENMAFMSPGLPTGGAAPAVVSAKGLQREGLPNGRAAWKRIDVALPLGWPVNSAADRRTAERGLVAHSGKAWDGRFSRFNRRLCRPLVRWLSGTPITPNAVTLAGLPVALLSGYWFAQGDWLAAVIGALLYFATVLVDEVDGMLARVTFRESAFGCWLESFVDYVTYLPVFGGMAIGLQRQYGKVWLILGGILLAGVVLTSAAAVYHRRLASRAVRPEQYLPRYYTALEADSANLVSRFIRNTHFVLKKGVLCHIVLVFSVLGLLPVFFAIAAFGTHAAWILGLHSSKLLVAPAGRTRESGSSGREEKEKLRCAQ